MNELRTAVDAAYAAHIAAVRAIDLPPNVKADRISETRVALQEATHLLHRAQRRATKVK
jgi:hypothetical protein